MNYSLLGLEDSWRHRGMRRALMKSVREKGITDENVLAAVNNVPRHIFFDPALVEHAYEDKAFPIGEGQTISQPYTVAFQTEKLAVQPSDKILEVGTGSGYQACVLAELGARVFTVEFNKKIFLKTRSFLARLNSKIAFYQGDGSLGLPGYAPFDKIIVTAGAPAVPDVLLEQLKIGGIAVVPVGTRTKQSMVKIVKTAEREFLREEFGNFSFVPFLGKSGWE